MAHWRRIKNEPHYQVSDDGRVRSNRIIGNTHKPELTGEWHELKQITNAKTGYQMVGLGTGKTRSVHRLVAEAFVKGHSSKRNDVNHIDGNKQNNDVSNLEWCTRSENIRHAYDNGLIPQHSSVNYRKVRVRVVETGEEFDSIEECAMAIGGQKSAICNCLNHPENHQTHKGYHFESV